MYVSFYSSIYMYKYKTVIVDFHQIYYFSAYYVLIVDDEVLFSKFY
jgi:hypothetical protein